MKFHRNTLRILDFMAIHVGIIKLLRGDFYHGFDHRVILINLDSEFYYPDLHIHN